MTIRTRDLIASDDDVDGDDLLAALLHSGPSRFILASLPSGDTATVHRSWFFSSRFVTQNIAEEDPREGS